ncbi:MAG: HypC/HybG/HupF family hydrogenase formation chaperone [Myxococcales bacterium]|nr:HypC/HybG/HupF family hydrogenase formation chaperone [Myxococcales bacterium]MDD9967365.1 HypC/HybG/HupF family hydrogenase formation chaperone [Myxococcales bacterium]
MCLAIPGCIETIDEGESALTRTARVRFGSIHKVVNLSLVPEAGVGDYVLVHVGVALQRIDALEAERVFELLDSLSMDEAEGHTR